MGESKHTPNTGRRCHCWKFHYTCADCEVDCTAGAPGGPATRSIDDGKNRCPGCHAKHEAAQIRLRGAAPLMLEALRRVEWLISVRGVGQCCPDCGGEEIDGHRAGCKLGGAIKAATGGEGCAGCGVVGIHLETGSNYCAGCLDEATGGET